MKERWTKRIAALLLAVIMILGTAACIKGAEPTVKADNDKQTTTAAMEIWVMTRLADGVLPTMGNGGAAAGMDAGGSSSPSFYLPPDTSTGTGGAGGGVLSGARRPDEGRKRTHP